MAFSWSEGEKNTVMFLLAGLVQMARKSSIREKYMDSILGCLDVNRKHLTGQQKHESLRKQKSAGRRRRW